jgi:branched-chain amino acid transport system substrate-binding protein
MLAARSGAHVELRSLDSFGPDRDKRALENAQAAAADPEAVAYLGDFHSSQILVTAPVLGEAGLLQVAPVATFVGLSGQTLVRLMPNDAAGAAALGRWLAAGDIASVLVVHDHDAGYGVPVGAMSAHEAEQRGLSTRIRPVWSEDEPRRGDLSGAQAVVYVGVAGPQTAELFQKLHALAPELWLLGSDGIAVPELARDLEPAVAEHVRLFVPQRGPFVLYGIQAMDHVLDALADSGGRSGIARAGRDTRERSSILGSYSLDEGGLTTTTEYGRLIVAHRQLVWDLG